MVPQLLATLTILFIARSLAADTAQLASIVPDTASVFMLGWGFGAVVFRRSVTPLRSAIHSSLNQARIR